MPKGYKFTFDQEILNKTIEICKFNNDNTLASFEVRCCYPNISIMDAELYVKEARRYYQEKRNKKKNYK